MSTSADTPPPTPGDASAAPPSADASLLAQLEAAQAEAAKFKDQYVRSLADMDNLRRRLTREKDDLRRAATAGLLEDLAPVLDNLRLGLQSALQAHPEAKAVIDGFQLVAGQLRAALAQHGVKEIDPLGQPFDPKFHESVSQLPSEAVPEGHVLQVLRPGYMLNDRLVRAATVVVSAGKK
jgi:molecular chaperone GrpE